MDRVPGKLPNTSSRLIAMAISLVGDGERVRLAMQSSPQDFLDYCSGNKEPSHDEFELLINLIVSEQSKMIAKNRELVAQIRARRRS